jgi:hypothetical protein
VRDDVFFDESAEGGASSTSSSGAASSSSGGTGDGGPDAPITCNDDLQISKEHCGRCGHGCGGGECASGKCQAIQISTVGGAPLWFIEASADYVFVSTITTLVTEQGGIWRVPKNGGQAEKYADLFDAEAMRVVGDKLWFVVADTPGDGGPDQQGGLWTCPIVGAAPCQPTRVVEGDRSDAIAVDGTRILFNDRAIGTRAFDTSNSQTATLNDKVPWYMYADGAQFFYNFTYSASQPYSARTLEAFPDGGTIVRHEYIKNNASAGTLVGTKDAIYVAALEFQTTTGGVVHRYPRTQGGLPCDYAGNANKRPYGITVDAERIYWTNLGEGATQPFTGGSVATCDLAGCCTTPETLWTGDGMPRGITNDAAFLYWVTKGTGGVWKVAKP